MLALLPVLSDISQDQSDTIPHELSFSFRPKWEILPFHLAPYCNRSTLCDLNVGIPANGSKLQQRKLTRV